MINLTTATSVHRVMFAKNKLLQLIVGLFVISWFWMWQHCIDVQDWFLENLLVFIFAIYITLTYKSKKLSDASYLLLFAFLWLHIFGAQYAYTKNPAGQYFQDTYNLARNPYDRWVHFSFGFLLVYPLHEMLRNYVGVKGKWQYILSVEIVLSLACIFELIEWAVAEATPKELGQSYVATQGDIWDAHKDIALAVLGAAITMCCLYFIRKRKGVHV
jgi:putative membrane protein